MKHNTASGRKNVFMSLAAVAAVMLLSAALVVPSSNAYAISQNGNGNSGNNGIFSLFFTLFSGSNDNGKTTTGSNDNGNFNGVNGSDDNRKGLKETNGADPKEHPTPECKNPVPQKYNKHCTGV